MTIRAHPGIGARLFGLGGVFGKTLRDSTAAALATGLLLVVMIVAGGMTMASTYGTPETRLELGAMSRSLPPILRGFYGNPVRVDTLGGFLSWHYGPYFALIGGLWSLLALSSTLAGEAARGSLDLVATSPAGRWRIAIAKVAAHVAALALVTAATGIAAWATGVAFGTQPGDAIAPGAAASFAIGLLVRSLATGATAFALAGVFGRSAGAGIAGAAMVGMYVVHGYRTVVPAFDTASTVSWWTWTADHLPLAAEEAWPAIGVTAAIAAVLLAAGVVSFMRRDIGVTIPIPAPRLPGAILGTRGPLTRSLGELLPSAWWWAVGLVAYGLLMAGSTRAMIDVLAASPGLFETFRSMIPGVDMTTPAGYLQMSFVDIGFLLIGMAVATFAASRFGDEGAGRLEMQLAGGAGRVRWALATWGSIVVATGAVTITLALAVGAGVASGGFEPWGAATGTLVLGAYGAALAGVAAATGSAWRPSAAAGVVLAVTVGTFLLDLLAPALRLPDWVAQLALTSHLGEPLVGRWDGAGLAACAVIAIGGAALGAWGMARRDIGR
ncbi:MAG: hypothetical protein WCK58_03065 [Chloroflexota bacterium]